ncbi:T9SS type A sorting domain-containing protein [candidate division KSB1 bacterium]|nr:T9SS type A sorting domain-containing protein [candidate division KSB1 bacterium]
MWHFGIQAKITPSLFSILLAMSGIVLAQSTGLPTSESSLFSGSANCAWCHSSLSNALTDSKGNDLSIDTDWRSTMMANSGKDPLWLAKVESEVLENPALQAVIEDKCTTCHIPMGRTQAVYEGASGYTLAAASADELAMDGVSCTLCHQIQDENLGTDDSYSGKYVIADSRQIFGPYKNISPMPMFNQTGYTPQFGEHIGSSEMCATCHTLFTPFIDDEGQIAGTFPEQTPFLEWENSIFSTQDKECQSCHMQRIDEAVTISNSPPWVGTQSPFWRHTFVGANTFVQGILRDNPNDIFVTATTAQFDSTIARTQSMLLEQTAKLTVESAWEDETLLLTVSLENLTGHKFPTGIPIRRAWLHVQVQTENGETVFESGEYDTNGRILNLSSDFEAHHGVINSANQVQIYEAVMADVNDEITYTLLRAAKYKKDNRLPPKGFVSTAERYDDMAIVGEAAKDPSFNYNDGKEGSGTDTVRYEIRDLSEKELKVEVELVYQTVKPAFIDDLLSHESAAVDRFTAPYENANKMPVVIQSAELEHGESTRVGETANKAPENFALQQNYPNPFNGETIIPFSVGEGMNYVELQIFDIAGQFVKTLIKNELNPGEYTAKWNGSNERGESVSTGVYIYTLRSENIILNRKFLYLK